jgi:hypothetical protein
MEYGTPVKIPDGRYFLKVSAKGDARVFHQVNNVQVDGTLTKETRQVNLRIPSKTLFESIDNELLSQAEVSKLEWFGKEVSAETIRSAYQASLSADGELSASLASIKGKVVTTFFDAQKNPIEEISGACDFMFELAGLWFLKRSFGPIWRVVQVRQRPAPKPKTKGYPVEFQFADEPDPEAEEDDDPTDYLD